MKYFGTIRERISRRLLLGNEADGRLLRCYLSCHRASKAELGLKGRKGTKRSLTNKRVETGRKRATGRDRVWELWGRRWCWRL